MCARARARAAKVKTRPRRHPPAQAAAVAAVDLEERADGEEAGSGARVMGDVVGVMAKKSGGAPPFAPRPGPPAWRAPSSAPACRR